MTPPFAPAPAGARRFADGWHKAECLVAVSAFGLIAVLLILDVAGREVLGPLYKLLGIKGATGIYGAQKLSVYALVLASFCGIGIATAVPSVGLGLRLLEAGHRKGEHRWKHQEI